MRRQRYREVQTFDMVMVLLAVLFFLACFAATAIPIAYSLKAQEKRIPTVDRQEPVTLIATPPRRPVPLEPDEEPIPPVNPNEILCDCLEFIEEVAEGERVHGTLCRCDHPTEGILWMFEGSAEGMRRLYEYLQEGVQTYYDELQRKRWKR